MENSMLLHYGIKGMKWGVRRYQNKDGTLTAAGEKRYDRDKRENAAKKKENRIDLSNPDPKRWATLNRVDQLLESIIPLLEGAQHSGTTVTLPAENWSGRAQTVKDNILLADEKYWYIVCADADCFMAVSETGVKADNITVNGQVTFHCEVTPTENLTIYILRLEVEQNNE